MSFPAPEKRLLSFRSTLARKVPLKRGASKEIQTVKKVGQNKRKSRQIKKAKGKTASDRITA